LASDLHRQVAPGRIPLRQSLVGGTPRTVFVRGHESYNYEQVRHIVGTYAPKPGDIERAWHVIDATDVRLGRLSVQVANLLRGKHKAIFAPNADTGDFVIVINAEKISLSGKKRTDKLTYRHSGFPGGLTATPIGEILDKDARKAVEHAVWGMLPKNKLGRQMITKLKVYSGPTHPHTAQKAQPFEIKQIAQ
jgi:large subunit ribosomal protein L13